jgi:hypothetical protein
LVRIEYDHSYRWYPGLERVASLHKAMILDV